MIQLLKHPFFRHPIMVILLGIFIIWLLSLSMPIVFAYITALLVEPIILKMSSHLHKKRKFVATIFFVLFFSIILLIGALLLFISWKQLSLLIPHIPDYLNQLSALWIQLQSKLAHYTFHLPVEFVAQLQLMITKIVVAIEKYALKLTNANIWSFLLSYLPSRFFAIFVYWIVLYMLLLDLPAVNRKLLISISFHGQQKILFIGQRVKIALYGFIKAQFLVGICIFSIAAIAFFLLKTPFPFILALLLVILDIIPFLDSFILLLPWAAYQFFVGDYVFAFSLIILTIVLFLARRLIEPKIIGNKIGLSSLTTFISMFIGFEIFGLLGIFIGPLCIVTIIALFQNTPTKNLPPSS
ncbi:sporulation integral membrane protein YtvI [Lysinibacillus piscis]|uniref:Sporulation integral membrane protein YtvI n=1 Tax=Lysinibacillus piscis TaxID=2518931 RepID=A0ABQ5NGU2_9BACI|nr:sporulation integral membrane protein YtvI [Lysinibacillus sp. KH24]GLC87581.1 sporulation integral membrane protein YtvI [Lysinibacillus sp. KH24]